MTPLEAVARALYPESWAVCGSRHDRAMAEIVRSMSIGQARAAIEALIALPTVPPDTQAWLKGLLK